MCGKLGVQGMTEQDAIDLIKKLLQAESQEALQEMIAHHLPQMDSAFFAVLTQAAASESTRNPRVGERLTSLAQVLLPLRTLI